MRTRGALVAWAAVVMSGVLGLGCGDAEPSEAEATTSSGAGASGTGGSGGSAAAGGGAACPAGSHEGSNGCEATFVGWTEGPALSNERDHHVTFVAVSDAGPMLYVAGGVVNNATLLDDIERAPILEDGALGAWSGGSALPGVAAGAGVAVVGATVVVTGGYRTTGGGNPTLSSATDVGVVMADGAIGSWAAGPALGATRFHHAMVADGEHLYVIGGLTGNNSDNIPNVERADVIDGAVGAWVEVTPLPGKRSHHGAAVHDHAIYVTGGLEGDPAGPHTNLDDVLRAPIAQDGSLGAWTVVGQLPTTLGTHASFVHAGALYVVGGIEGGTENTFAVRRAPIGADGALGAWEDVAPLPKARAHAHQTPLYDGFVYAPGGAYNHISNADVYIGRFE